MKAGKALLPIAVPIAALLIGPASASATLNLGRAPGSIRVDGGAAGDLLGYSIASAGDVNGDGHSDLIVGARDAGNNGRPNSGSAYVVYGGQSLASLDLHNLGAQGFRIDGAAQGDRAGYSVAGAGDMNGDGIADVIVGANNADRNSVTTNSGKVYVIYGEQCSGPTPPGTTPPACAAANDPADVDLANIPGTGTQTARGMEIDGAGAGNLVGYSIAGLGDVNADGFKDIVVGAPGTSSGSAYVIYGQTGDAPDLDLADVSTNPAAGARGIEIDGTPGDGTGESVAGPGSVNDDNHPDILIGAPDASNNNRAGSGSAYVVYGSGQDLTSVSLSSLGSAGFRIDGAVAGDNLGESSNSVAGAGDDVNGDGLHDVIVGARFADNNGRTDSGSAYVVYGKNTADPGNVDLNALGTRGMEVDGATAGENVGTAVDGAGDVNGDQIPDLVVGARFADYSGANSGSAYVIYGKSCNVTPLPPTCADTHDPTNLDLATVTTDAGDNRGVRIDGAAADDRAGRAVAGSADLNGDGGRDVLIGAAYANNNGRVDSGSGYVLPDVTAPDTTITSGPKDGDTITKSTATFEFTANDPSTFMCSLDQGTASYSACTSPYTTRKLRNGTYTFRVFATDAHGNADPTPAKRTFTVHTGGKPRPH